MEFYKIKALDGIIQKKTVNINNVPVGIQVTLGWILVWGNRVSFLMRPV